MSIKGFGSRLKTARIKKNFTLQELSDITGFSKSTLSEYENNETINPKLTYVIDLARVLEVPISYLTGENLGVDDKKDYINEVLNDYPELKLAFHDYKKLSDEEIKGLKNDIELMLKLIIERHKLKE